jgi:hypothetical protein
MPASYGYSSGTAPEPDPWAAFALDPREPAHASLRAADADREIVGGWLTTAYAEGRLDREELDERQEQLQRTKLLGDLPGLVADLRPARTPVPTRPAGALARASHAELRQMAEERHRAHVLGAVTRLLTISAVVWTVWFLSGGGWPWPAIVSVVLLGGVIRTAGNRQENMRRELERLEKKQRRQLKRPETPMGDA